MDNYIKVQACFEKNNCTLLTTFDEFEERRKVSHKQSYQFTKVDFIGECTHTSSAVYTNFNLRKTGIRCKDCILQYMKNYDRGITQKTEYNGIEILKEYLSATYEICNMKEGCTADLGIRLHSEKENKWIPIQIKTVVDINHGMYSFSHIYDGYKNMLIICICIEEKKLWILPYNHLKNITKLNISVKSKYSKYLVDNSIIDTYIVKYIDNITYRTLEDLNIPRSIYQQKEQEYVRKREKYIPFLNYVYPDIQNTSVDVIINGKKVQEKVMTFVVNKQMFSFKLGRNNGKINKVRKFRMYQLGDNDYYWLHSQIDDRFWIIPEAVLYKLGYIANKDEIKKDKHICFCSKSYNSKEWLKLYEHDYKNIDKEKIVRLFC
jgi:hypothetical protein